jgi:Putative DNA-binding domain
VSQVIGAGSEWPGELQWHGEMHRRIGARSLHFWFLRFVGIYEKAEVFGQILECVGEVDAVAYAGYELSGEFDIMLRLWLPPGEVGRFAELLKRRLPIRSNRNYSVIETVRHWVWEAQHDGEESRVAGCEIDSLDPTSLLEDVETLNRLSDASRKSARVDAPLAKDARVLDRFLAAKAITLVNPGNGIRLVMRLSPGEDVNDTDLARITEGVARELHALRDTPGREPAKRSASLRIRELSLYRCTDNTLIGLCRIDYLAWHLFRDQLLSRLARIPGLAQSTTFPVFSAGLEISREALIVDGEVRDSIPEPDLSDRLARRIPAVLRPGPLKPREEGLDPSGLPQPPSEPLAVSRYFNSEEGGRFETKGSAFSKLEDWLDRGPDDPEHLGLKEERGFFRDTIAKSIVSMLNTEGGVILIGVLEAERYDEDLRERIKLRLEAYPREGRFYLLGLQDPIYRKGRWDGFDRKFQEMLKPLVDGVIGRRVQLSPGWHDGREFAIVQVRGPGTRSPRRPYYLNDGEPHFYIRRGGRNEPLKGREVHEYLEDDWEAPGPRLVED